MVLVAYAGPESPSAALRNIGTKTAYLPTISVTDQPQCRGLWHFSRPSTRSLTRLAPSPPQSRGTLLPALPFFPPAVFHEISLSPGAFTSA